MRENTSQYYISDCPECGGCGHKGHDMTDIRPEHLENGDCRTCPVRCFTCGGTGICEMPIISEINN